MLSAVVQEMHDFVSPDKECTSIPGVKCRQHITEKFAYMDRCDTLLHDSIVFVGSRFQLAFVVFNVTSKPRASHSVTPRSG